MKRFYTLMAVVAISGMMFTSCSKDKDDDPKPSTTNTNNTGGSGGGGGGTNNPPSNETINYNIEFISGPRAGTKMVGSLSGFSNVGYSVITNGEEALYTSFSHGDSASISAYATMGEDGKARPLNSSSSDDSYVIINMNPLSQDIVMIESRSGSCTVSNITRATESSDASGSEVRRAGYTFQFEGAFVEATSGSTTTTEHTIRGTIAIRLLN